MRTLARLLAAAGLALLALLGVASAAPALSSLDAVAAGLQQSPLYNDPQAEAALTTSQAQQLLDQMGSTTTPIYLAVVPQSFVAANGGTPRAALTNLINATRRNGTYGLVAGRSFVAVSNTVQGASAAATQAVSDNKGGTSYDVLSSFVTSVSDLAGSGGSTAGGGSSSTSGGGFPWGWVIVGGGLLGIAGFGAYSINRSRKQKAAELAEVKAVLDEDVTSLGEELAAIDVHDPRIDDASRADLQKALDSYSAASDAAARLTDAKAAATVTGHLEDGRFALATARARMDGRPLPERLPPCFFDPRHGPSVTEVTWTPPGGAPRPTPACAACAGTVLRGSTPDSRQVPVGPGGDTRPYWQAGPMYGGYAGGYFGSFGSVLPSILVGTMLGNALFPHSPVIVENNYGGGMNDGGFGGSGGGFDSGSFGDFGGGDFGGGDMGGGDF